MNNRLKKDFTITPNELINDSSISRNARFLFVYLCSKPEDWKYYAKKIEKDLGCSKDSRIKYQKELIESGWITVTQKVVEKGKFGENEIQLNPYPKKSDTVEKPQPKKSDTEKNRIGKSTPLNNTESNKDLFSKKEETKLDLKVLKYLNDNKPSKRPFEDSSANLKKIRLRIKEKFVFSDFKKVIDFKISEWKDSTKMKKYIRPETLFGDKFNSYLVEAESKEESKNTGSDNFTNFEKPQKAELK